MDKNKLKISSQYQITLPKAARTALDLNNTDVLMLEIIEGVLCLRRMERPAETKQRKYVPRWPDWRFAPKPEEGGDGSEESRLREE